MVCGLALEVLGYVERVQMHSNPFKKMPFILYVTNPLLPSFLPPFYSHPSNTSQPARRPDNRTRFPLRSHLPLPRPHNRNLRLPPLAALPPRLHLHIHDLRPPQSHPPIRRRRHRQHRRRSERHRSRRQHHDRRSNRTGRESDCFRRAVCGFHAGV